MRMVTKILTRCKYRYEMIRLVITVAFTDSKFNQKIHEEITNHLFRKYQRPQLLIKNTYKSEWANEIVVEWRTRVKWSFVDIAKLVQLANSAITKF